MLEVSNVHSTVVREIKKNKPAHEVLKDLFISFMAVSLNEISACSENDKKAVVSYSINQLNMGIDLMNKCLEYSEKKVS